MNETIRKLNDTSRPSAGRPVRHVVAALILRGDENGREVLVCQRRPDQPMGSKWEFPGGKVEDGETAEAALARELNEELGIQAHIGRRLAVVHTATGTDRRSKSSSSWLTPSKASLKTASSSA